MQPIALELTHPTKCAQKLAICTKEESRSLDRHRHEHEGHVHIVHDNMPAQVTRLDTDIRYAQPHHSQRRRALSGMLPCTCVGLGLSAAPNASTALQPLELFARDLQSGVENARGHSRLIVRIRCHAMPRQRTRLRARLDRFFGFSNRYTWQCSSGGATHRARIHACTPYCGTRPTTMGRAHVTTLAHAAPDPSSHTYTHTIKERPSDCRDVPTGPVNPPAPGSALPPHPL